MSDLENFLDSISKKKSDDKLVILQKIVEKILNYLLTTIETTERRIVDLNSGINNITHYIGQQLNDLTGRLRQLPGMEDLKNVSLPDATSCTPTSEMETLFFNDLKEFIETKSTEILTRRDEELKKSMDEEEEESDTFDVFKEDDDGEEKEIEEVPEISKDQAEKLKTREKEIGDKEQYLSQLAEQLAAKELQLQERENTIEIIESGLQDRLKLSAAMEMVEIEDGEGDEIKDLEDLSALSDSIIQGDGIIDNDDEEDDD